MRLKKDSLETSFEKNETMLKLLYVRYIISHFIEKSCFKLVSVTRNKFPISVVVKPFFICCDRPTDSQVTDWNSTLGSTDVVHW